MSYNVLKTPKQAKVKTTYTQDVHMGNGEFKAIGRFKGDVIWILAFFIDGDGVQRLVVYDEKAVDTSIIPASYIENGHRFFVM